MAVSGGPEAIHQLSDAIAGFGGEVVIAYYGAQMGISIEDALISCSYSGSPTPSAYRDYRSFTAARIPLTSRSLVIFPEPVIGWAMPHRPFTQAIWWLSVDNALIKSPALSYESHRQQFFQTPHLIHFYQSDYARDFLTKGGAKKIYPLADYTAERFHQSSKSVTRDQSITYFPRKGGALASVFFDSHPELNRVPVENMTPDAVHETLRKSQIYIDFGHHPGKDRVPREAALSGNIVFLHERGAAAFHMDHPLDRFFLFISTDVSNGSLYERVKQALADPDKAFSAQRIYHARIATERDEFSFQVKFNFFAPEISR